MRCGGRGLPQPSWEFPGASEGAARADPWRREEGPMGSSGQRAAGPRSALVTLQAKARRRVAAELIADLERIYRPRRPRDKELTRTRRRHHAHGPPRHRPVRRTQAACRGSATSAGSPRISSSTRASLAKWVVAADRREVRRRARRACGSWRWWRCRATHSPSGRYECGRWQPRTGQGSPAAARIP